MSSQSRSRDGVLPTRSTEVSLRFGDLADHMKELYTSVAHRAYELFEGRGCEQGHDLEDWFEAERDILRPLPVKIDETGNRFAVTAELQGFTEDEIQVFAEPKRIVIDAGSDYPAGQRAGAMGQSSRRTNRFLASIDIPDGADPSSARATLTNGILEVRLTR